MNMIDRSGDTVTLTDEGFEIADRIDLWLEAHPGFHNASKIARGAKCSTTEAHAVLGWLLDQVMVKAAGNGCWINYSAR
ncbi:hypothetical protein FGG30_gp076 [Mycobacterium phage Pixie]|uniref:Uncharacterized protein n=2 Tax=Keshuvirus pixie TaxID=1034114 RepID=G1D4Y5_9CAUD|nr:hypothetical protein FGG30_gp076 [Mycobacterium phage Pixie]AEK09886.1 hypothetical protein PBI_PIXIE_76 [Mycobacterium phage Pixie]AOT23812.1 hypothetical protein SEA_TBOND007_73 [Mycobacterium phage TBond007]